MACRPGISTETYTPFADGLPCSDGDLCTLQDSCVAGVCEAGDDKGCDDSLECTADTCDSSTGGCTHTPINACLISNTCLPVDTPNPNNACEACRPESNVYSYSAVANDLPCNDNNACTLSDPCHTGSCTPGGSQGLRRRI